MAAFPIFRTSIVELMFPIRLFFMQLTALCYLSISSVGRKILGIQAYSEKTVRKNRQSMPGNGIPSKLLGSMGGIIDLERRSELNPAKSKTKSRDGCPNFWQSEEKIVCCSFCSAFYPSQASYRKNLSFKQSIGIERIRSCVVDIIDAIFLVVKQVGRWRILQIINS